MTFIHNVDKTPQDEMDNLIYNVLAVLLDKFGEETFIFQSDFDSVAGYAPVVEVIRVNGENIVRAYLAPNDNDRHPADYITG